MCTFSCKFVNQFALLRIQLLMSLGWDLEKELEQEQEMVMGRDLVLVPVMVKD